MKYFIGAIIVCYVFSGCSRAKDPLPGQLTAYLQSHLNNIDTAVKVSNLEILKTDSINGRIGLLIEDSIYSLERNRIVQELVSARRNNRSDSVSFLEEEISYMNHEIDSISKLQEQITDSVKKYGIVVKTTYELGKNGQNARDTVYWIIAIDGNIFNLNYLDDHVRATISRLK